jgi:RNA polymerase sigma factor (sigma-70 family)
MSFKEDFKHGENLSKYIADNFFKYHFKSWEYIDDVKVQKSKHIDYVCIGKDNIACFAEVKTEKKYTGNLVYEVYSDLANKKKGWGPLSEATWLFYYFQSYKLFVINYSKFKEIAESQNFKITLTNRDKYKVSQIKLVPVNYLLENLDINKDIFVYSENRGLCKTCPRVPYCDTLCPEAENYLSYNCSDNYLFSEINNISNESLEYLANKNIDFTEDKFLDELFPPPEKILKEIEREELEAKLQQLIQTKLNANEKRIIKMYFWESRTQDEISRILKISQPTVSRIISTCLDKLKEIRE